MLTVNVYGAPRRDLVVPTSDLAGVESEPADPADDPPAKSLSGVRIEWRQGRRDRRAEPSPEMLDGFLRLAKAPDDALPAEVLAYARAYGPLFPAPCERDDLEAAAERRGSKVERPYGIRHAHDPERRSTCRRAPYGPLPLATRGWEPVLLWRRVARRVAGVLDVAESLERGELGPMAAWMALSPHLRRARNEQGTPISPVPRDVPGGRLHLQAAIRDLFEIGAVRLALDVEPVPPKLWITGDGLAGALAVQAALRVSRSEGVALCAECGRPVPDRRPDSRRAFCSEHRTDAIRRKWAGRDWRARERAKTAGDAGGKDGQS